MGPLVFLLSEMRSYGDFKQNIFNMICFLKDHSRFYVEKNLKK